MTNKQAVFLRPATAEDVKIIHKWWSDGQIMKEVGFPNCLSITIEEVFKDIEKYQKEENADFLIILSEEKIEIGEFAYKKISMNTYTFDIKIGEYAYQRKGYGKLALLKGINIIKSKSEVERIEISVDPENIKALSLYKSVGFKSIRRINNNWKNQLGESRSTEVLEFIF
ncbi:GNAT family N-acetyltransferase [Vagococcus fluvialis]|uniref:GNAT family N-acetyltransferase n=1 Tax=Vagococcus fluvialis TaxID=2738 RepID=UPI003B59F8AC